MIPSSRRLVGGETWSKLHRPLMGRIGCLMSLFVSITWIVRENRKWLLQEQQKHISNGTLYSDWWFWTFCFHPFSDDFTILLMCFKSSNHQRDIPFYRWFAVVGQLGTQLVDEAVKSQKWVVLFKAIFGTMVETTFLLGFWKNRELKCRRFWEIPWTKSYDFCQSPPQLDSPNWACSWGDIRLITVPLLCSRYQHGNQSHHGSLWDTMGCRSSMVYVFAIYAYIYIITLAMVYHNFVVNL